MLNILVLRKISQKDIAESLNISRVTVTRALQGHPEISRETIRKVKEKALEMGYIPDFIGRSLSSKRTYTLGLVVPKIAHSFFSISIEHMYEASRMKGYNLIPTVSFEDSERELDNIRTLLSMQVDGIILDMAQNSLDNSSYDLAVKAGCKVLFFDRCPASFSGDAVLANDRDAAFRLTQLLLSKGYRKIYHFAGPPYLNISLDRKRGYEEAMQEADVPSHVFGVDLKRESGKRALNILAEKGELPEAILAVNDPVAHGIYEAAKELGIKIPGDIAVAGVGDVDASAMLNPPMTSIKPPLEQMAKTAIDTLIGMIENPLNEGERQVFDAEIVERKST